MKDIRQLSENVKSADKKPEIYTDPSGKKRVRMVATDREVVKTDEANIDEISLQSLSKTVAKSTGTKNITKAMGKDKIKKDLAAMRAKLATEEKDPEEYDQEGDMMKGQLRQICSANEKLMSMVKDDDNLPEWVQSKVTKATDYIRSVRDYLESEQMDEKTLTPAEKKKREDIAKAMEKENPDMPMAKKMAIATATAKRVAEATDDDYHKTLGPTKNSDEGIAALKKKHGMSHTKAVATLKRLMGESVEEAVGTSAKYAGKSGMFGGKYTSKDHMLGMKNFSQVRKKRQDQRDAEHKQQDPKMAKMGYAKHMVDTQKAAKKAAAKGADPLKTARSTYHQKNGITPNRKLPENYMMEDNEMEKKEMMKTQLHFIKYAAVNAFDNSQLTQQQLDKFSSLRPGTLFNLLAKSACYLPFESFCAYATNDTVENALNSNIVKYALVKELPCVFSDMQEKLVSSFSDMFTPDDDFCCALDPENGDEVQRIMDDVKEKFSIEAEPMKSRIMKITISKAASESQQNDTLDFELSDEEKNDAKKLAHAYGMYKISSINYINNNCISNNIDNLNIFTLITQNIK